MSTEFSPPELSSEKVSGEGGKVAFLAAYDRLEKVTDAAREVGVTTMVGHRWLVVADINPRRREVERHAEYDRLGSTGISRQAAAKQVGVHIRLAIDWNQGDRKSGRVRIHPNGRVGGYKCDVPKLHERRARLAGIGHQLRARCLSLLERE